MIPPALQVPAVISTIEYFKVFRPEHDGMNILRAGGYLERMTAVWIHDLKTFRLNSLQEPVHIKCRDIGSAGGGEDTFHFWIVS